jgi:hypothetical protein
MNYYKFNPTINKLLEQYGNRQIESITIYRKPIQSYINQVLNTLSLGQLNKNLKEANYDKLFHLYMIVKLSYYEYILIEKNERINIHKVNKIDNMIENKEINNINNLTINEMLNNTINRIGNDNFYTYKAHSWNCQNFIMNVLKSNNLLDNELMDFILQDTEKIFYKMGYLKPISDMVTDTAATLNIIKEGGKINDKINDKQNYIVQSIIFKNMSIDECIKFCQENNFKFNKVIYKKNNSIVIRQYTPNYVKKKGYINYVTHKVNNNIILNVVYKDNI